LRPLTLPGILEEQRAKLHTELYEMWIDGQKNVCACGWGRTFSDDYEMLPTEMLKLSISNIIATMELVYTGDMRIGSKPCNDDGHGADFYHETPEIYHATPLKRLNRMKDHAGICIEMV
jgi:hypothetical protein